MKYLTVIRHAKSSWDQPGLADHDRVLNERGRRAAVAVGTFLHQTYFGGGDVAAVLTQPDRFVSSTAVRARSTAQIICERMQIPAATHMLLDSQLYLAPPATLLKTLHRMDESWQHVVFFGHNPGLHEFCGQMLARAEIPRMPTCTVVIMALPCAYWALADWHQAQLVGYLTPKLLERRFPALYKGISVQDQD
jgi:phosphohistidine phosphatase